MLQRGMRGRRSVATAVGLVVVALVGAGTLAACGRAVAPGGSSPSSQSSRSGEPAWSPAATAAVVALLDHTQGLVALGRQGEATAIDPAVRAEATQLAVDATGRARALDALLLDAGVDYAARAAAREPTDAVVPAGVMTCDVSRGDALGVLAATPPEAFDAAFLALVRAQAAVEVQLMEAAAGIEPASSALQALA